MAAAAEHIREVENVAMGRASRRDPWVVESWLRCINEHRLDSTRACEAFILPENQLKAHRQQSEDLIQLARSGLETLYAQMAGQNYVLLLGDRAGVAVEFLGDPNFDHRLRKAGLYLGAEWSEPRDGTCAIGACIARGEFAAVLDISLLSSPIAKASRNLALHMVAAMVGRIELANLMAQTRHEWVLRFSRSPDFLDVDPEAAISLDGSDRVIGMTHGGAEILARAAGLSWRRPVLIVGQPLGRFLDLDLDDLSDLSDLTRQRPTRDRLVVARDGNRLFAHAIEPQRRRSQRRPHRRCAARSGCSATATRRWRRCRRGPASSPSRRCRS